MTNLSEREKAFEAKYRNDEELRFKVGSRRNKLLGLWAARRFGLDDAAAQAYAKDVVIAEFDRPGDDDVFDKVKADFASYGVDMSDHRLRRQMDELLEEAARQVASEME